MSWPSSVILSFCCCVAVAMVVLHLALLVDVEGCEFASECLLIAR